jgi:hypothetical protein
LFQIFSILPARPMMTLPATAAMCLPDMLVQPVWVWPGNRLRLL